MFGSLGQFVVKVADLAEAEGRVARRQLLRMGAALLTAIAAIALGLGGVVAVCVGLYLALAEVMHPAVALLVIGAGLLLVASVIGVVGWRTVGHDGD